MNSPLSPLLLLLVFKAPLTEAGESCRHIYNSSTGSLQSENYPDRYDDYTECECFIRPVLDASHILKLVPEDFDLEGGYDMLEVRELGPHGRYIGQFTGSIMPILYGKAFWLRFTSDYSITKKGFKFSWTVAIEGVRLVNGSEVLEGRVEVFHAGKWGTICDDSWEPAEAYVSCRMMGFKDMTARHFTQGHFGRGVDPIWLDNTKCSTNMTSLGECRTDSWGANNCNHGEDSGVRCTEAAENIKRLVGKRTSFPKGCSQWLSNTTGSLSSPQFPLYPNYAHCQYTIGTNTKAIQRHMLKFTFSLFDLQEGFDFLEIREDGPSGVFLGHFTGNRLPPTIYAKTLWMSFTSDASIGRRGFLISWEPSSTGVRLRNGTLYNEGRVEIYRNGNWGTICDDSWDNNEATVLCYMLGYRDQDPINGTALTGGQFGPGTGNIDFDDMSCTGMEEDIHDCSFNKQHNCNHYEDAGLRCNSKTNASPVISNDSSIQEDITDAVRVSCDSLRLRVTVNLTSLGDRYSDLYTGNMYLTLATPDCVGEVVNDAIVFNNDITDCGVTATENRNNVIYRNRMVSHENGTFANNVTQERISFVIPIECSLAKTLQLSSQMSVYLKKTKSKTVRGYGNFTAELNFFKDPGFSQQIRDYPMYVELGQEMYVETRILTKDLHLRLVLYECVATTDPNSTKSESKTLISNRCARERSTRLLPSPSNSSSRFLFKTLQFLQQKGQVFIKCSLLVCNVSDTSSRCSPDCPDTRRGRRSSQETKRYVQVVQGPIILKSRSKVSQPASTIHVGGIIAACAVTSLVVLAAILAVIARKKKKVAMWYVNRVYTEYDAQKDQVMMLPMET